MDEVGRPGALPESVTVVWLEDRDDGQRNADLDAVLGADVAARRRGPLVRIWRAARRPGIGVSRRDVATVQAQDAVRRLRQEGLDVVVRSTGGTAVPQGDGVFHVSWLVPRTAGSTTDAYYRLLCHPLLSWLASLGVHAQTGELPGSYCDGRYNVLAGGRKLAGTAQAWRGGLAGMPSRHPGYVLAHACVTVDVDHAAAARRINRFYAWAGSGLSVDAGTAVNLRELVPHAVSGMDAAQATAWAVDSFAAHLERWLADRGARVATTGGGFGT